jgi:hypothetical protein
VGEKYFTIEEIILFCKLCEVKVMAEKRFAVQQHCNTAKHKISVNREFAVESRQRLLFQKSHSSYWAVHMGFPRIFVKLWFRQTFLYIKYRPPGFESSWKNTQHLSFPPNPH